MLRDFNSHAAWHPAVTTSEIEGGEPSDQVGCVRRFALRDGHRISEQLLALSDREHTSTYCILEATLPMHRYVATLSLKRVTDGERTFWHWQMGPSRRRETESASWPIWLAAPCTREASRGCAPTCADREPPVIVQHPGAARPPRRRCRRRAWWPLAFGGPEVFRPSARSRRARPDRGGPYSTDRGRGELHRRLRAHGPQPGMIEPPAPLGMEAAGVVVDIGPGVAHLLPGDRVAYACPPPGAYVNVRTMPADQVMVLPDEVNDETAAAVMLKGMTAECLLHRVHRVRPGEVVLVHAAAGGVGLLLCQWAKALGARVIGTVSTEDKARLARAGGCDVPIVSRDYRFAEAAREAADGRGVDVIYDGLGAAAMEENLDAIALCGHWVSYGQASGPLPPVAAEVLSGKSATFSRPVLFHYTAERAARHEIAQRVFTALRDGVLRIELRHRYPLAAVADAHRDLEARRTNRPAGAAAVDSRPRAAVGRLDQQRHVLGIGLALLGGLDAAAQDHRVGLGLRVVRQDDGALNTDDAVVQARPQEVGGGYEADGRRCGRYHAPRGA